MTKRLYIFDADGTLRWTTIPGQPCPNTRDEWRLMPNVAERLQSIRWGPGQAGLGIASNQGGVAAGYLTRDLALRLMEDLVVAAIGYFPPGTAIEMCTCPSSVECDCRKPRPGMLLRIMSSFRVRAEETLYVGDLALDREAARRAGIDFVWAWDFFGWAPRPE